MPEIFKDLKMINSFSNIIRLLSVVRIILTVVIIAFSVITGARYILAPDKN